MKQVITFGELMLSVATKGNQRLVQADEFIVRTAPRQLSDFRENRVMKIGSGKNIQQTGKVLLGMSDRSNRPPTGSPKGGAPATSASHSCGLRRARPTTSKPWSLSIPASPQPAETTVAWEDPPPKPALLVAAAAAPSPQPRKFVPLDPVGYEPAPRPEAAREPSNPANTLRERRFRPLPAVWRQDI